MPRSGNVDLDSAVVQEVVNRQSGTSRVVVVKGAHIITIEKVGPFPDGMHLRPGDTIDVSFHYDQRVKA